MSDLSLTNTSVAALYREPSFASEIISQSFLGETLTVLEADDKWAHVRLEDDYEGWLDSYHVVPKPEDWDGGQRYATDDLVSSIHESPDASAIKIRDVTLLSELPLTGREEGWVKIRLPDGHQGWLRDNPRQSVDHADPEGIIATATRFLGIEYLWGGLSPKGFDCSGFVQTVFALNGIQLPRDSYQQAEVGEALPNDWQAWEAGDLVFFTFYGKPIAHVGIVVGNGDIMHASGYVRFNNLSDPQSELYSPSLVKAFVKARRILNTH